MKNKIIIIFLFTAIFTLSSLNVQAYGTIYPGGALNPLYIQIAPQPGDRLDALIQQQNQDRIYQQQVLQNQLLQQQIELQKSQSLQQRINSQPIQQSGTLCNGKYWNACPVGNNFVCPNTGSAYCEIPKSNDQICMDTYGLNTSFTQFDPVGGKRVCDCKAGYIWNDKRTSCTIDYNKICSDKFGSGFTWYGTINNDGGPDCSSTAPVIKNKETKAVTPVIKKVSEVKTTQSEVKKDIFTNTANLALVDSDTKVVTSAEVTKPKSFWTKFIGWLGF